MSATPAEKIIRMANQIAQFMESKPHEEGLTLLASHINDFWEPRMRIQLFSVLDHGGDVWAAVQSVVRRAGLAPAEARATGQAAKATGISPHVMRHTAATAALKGGRNANPDARPAISQTTTPRGRDIHPARASCRSRPGPARR